MSIKDILFQYKIAYCVITGNLTFRKILLNYFPFSSTSKAIYHFFNDVISGIKINIIF